MNEIFNNKVKEKIKQRNSQISEIALEYLTTSDVSISIINHYFNQSFLPMGKSCINTNSKALLIEFKYINIIIIKR